MTDLDIEAVTGLIDVLAWPLLALLAGFFFRAELRALLTRIRRGAGWEFDGPAQVTGGPPAALVPAGTPANAPMDGLRTPASALLEAEVLAFGSLPNRTGQQDRETYLVAMAARLALFNQFEGCEGLIWASQIKILEYLNTRPSGEADPTLEKLFYAPAATQSPNVFGTYNFDAYMQFLVNFGMVVRMGEQISITDRGREYLVWRIAQRKLPKAAG